MRRVYGEGTRTLRVGPVCYSRPFLAASVSRVALRQVYLFDDLDDHVFQAPVGPQP